MSHMSRKSSYIAALMLAGVSALPAVAGGMSGPETSPTIAPAAPVATGTDWTGFYLGGQVGMGSTEIAIGSRFELDLDHDSYGVHLGYLYDFGTLVAGVELSYDEVDFEANPYVDGATRTGLDVSLGYDLGRILPYVLVGIASFEPDGFSAQSGYSYGIGAKYLISDNLMAGLSYRQSDYSDFLEDTIPFDNDMSEGLFSLSLSYKF